MRLSEASSRFKRSWRDWLSRIWENGYRTEQRMLEFPESLKVILYVCVSWIKESCLIEGGEREMKSEDEKQRKNTSLPCRRINLEHLWLISLILVVPLLHIVRTYMNFLLDKNNLHYNYSEIGLQLDLKWSTRDSLAFVCLQSWHVQ